MTLTLIAAMTEDRVIGKDGELPWHIPEEQDHFYYETLGKAIIMGRKTFDNIGSLNNRHNIVLSRTMDSSHNDATICQNKEEALEESHLAYGETCVIGGESIYEQFIDMADRMVISIVDRDVDGDRHFPDFDLDNWNVDGQRIENQYTVMEYSRKEQ